MRNSFTGSAISVIIRMAKKTKKKAKKKGSLKKKVSNKRCGRMPSGKGKGSKVKKMIRLAKAGKLGRKKGRKKILNKKRR